MKKKTKQPQRLNRIKEVLEEQNKTQQWLATKAEITYASINMYYNGKREPSLETLAKIAKKLKVSIKGLVADQ